MGASDYPQITQRESQAYSCKTPFAINGPFHSRSLSVNKNGNGANVRLRSGPAAPGIHGVRDFTPSGSASFSCSLSLGNGCAFLI